MRRRMNLCLMGLLAVCAPALADDVTGADRLLCTPVVAAECWDDGECEAGPAWVHNIPSFIEVDLKKKLLSTTAASGSARTSSVAHLERADGEIVMQGVDNGRVWSWSIEESSGRLRAAVIADDEVVVVFGACTPITGR